MVKHTSFLHIKANMESNYGIYPQLKLLPVNGLAYSNATINWNSPLLSFSLDSTSASI